MGGPRRTSLAEGIRRGSKRVTVLAGNLLKQLQVCAPSRATYRPTKASPLVGGFVSRQRML